MPVARAMTTTSWWEILITAFFAALAGSSVGGWLTYRERLRNVRAKLFGSYLVPFHDRVNDRRVRVEETREPLWTGVLTDGSNVSELFQLLDHEAATASPFDRLAVGAVWAYLEAIDDAGKPYHDRSTEIGRDEEVALACSCAAAQLAHWTELNEYLWRYRAWLEWKLTKRPWSLRMPKGAELAIRKPPKPPKRLSA